MQYSLVCYGAIHKLRNALEGGRGVGICVMKCHGRGVEVKKWSNLRYITNEWPLLYSYFKLNIYECNELLFFVR